MVDAWFRWGAPVAAAVVFGVLAILVAVDAWPRWRYRRRLRSLLRRTRARLGGHLRSLDTGLEVERDGRTWRIHGAAPIGIRDAPPPPTPEQTWVAVQLGEELGGSLWLSPRALHRSEARTFDQRYEVSGDASCLDDQLRAALLTGPPTLRVWYRPNGHLALWVDGLLESPDDVVTLFELAREALRQLEACATRSSARP